MPDRRRKNREICEKQITGKKHQGQTYQQHAERRCVQCLPDTRVVHGHLQMKRKGGRKRERDSESV